MICGARLTTCLLVFDHCEDILADSDSVVIWIKHVFCWKDELFSTLVLSVHSIAVAVS
jgi:hypothetical protein